MTVSHLTTPASNLFQLFLDRYEDDVVLDSLTMSKTEQVAAILSHVAGEPAGANLRLSFTEMIAAILSEETGEPAGANLRMSLAEMLAGIVDAPSFTPESLFANGEKGFSFAFAKTDRTWQEFTGETQSDDDGETVGLALEGSQWGGKSYAAMLAGQPNIAPPFVSAGTGWTVTNSDTTHKVTFGEGTAHFEVESASPITALSAAILTGGQHYYLTGSIVDHVNGELKFDVAPSQSITLPASIGEFDYIFRAGPSGTFSFYRASAGVTDMTLGDFIVKHIPGNHALQATLGARPIRQTDGSLAFDGSKSLVTTFAPGSAGSIFAKILVPETISALQVIIGGSVGTSRCFIGVNTSGFACAGIGTDAETVIVGDEDLRDTTCSIGVTWNGTTVTLYVNGVAVYMDDQAGSIGSDPLRIGGSNNGGTAGNFWVGRIYDDVATDDVVTAEEAAKLHTSWGLF